MTHLSEAFSALLKQNNQQRYRYLIKEIIKNNEVWILTDEHGCVMLNSEDEDCVPIWPNKEFAELWATGEWEHCEPKAIALKLWQQKWTDGLADDELALVVFPISEQDGLIIYPDELDYELRKKK